MLIFKILHFNTNPLASNTFYTTNSQYTTNAYNMKWTYAIPQKFKISCILGFVMLCITLFTLIESRNINNINRSLVSIYTDRLIPATDLFYLAEHLYTKRTKIENYLRTNETSPALISKELNKHNAEIAILISKFEMTHLVNDELIHFDALKSELKKYILIEQQIINQGTPNQKEPAKVLFENNAKPALARTLNHLSALTKIQSNVGTTLLNQSKNDIAISDLLSNLQLIVCIVTGILIITIISASKVTSGKEQRFKLN